MKSPVPHEIWYVTGSQHLYGEAALKQVAANSQKIVAELTAAGTLPLPLVFKPILTRPYFAKEIIGVQDFSQIPYKGPIGKTLNSERVESKPQPAGTAAP